MRTNLTLLALLCLTASQLDTTWAGDAKGVRAGYKRPTITVPYAWTKPTIDGAVHEEEWRGAESIDALQTTRKQISARRTRFWMLWDEDNLYLAMRSPLRPGERVIQALRRRTREKNVVFDDSYEVWLDVGALDPKTGLVCFFQFLANYAGARYDTLHLPSVGNSRLTFNTGWEPKSRITPGGKAWEWELVVPRESVFRSEPFKDGFELTCLLARNFKRPWEQNSVEGTSSFAVLDTHSLYKLSKSAPAVHLLQVADHDKGSFGLHLAATGRKAGRLKWRFAADGGIEKTGTLAYRPDGLAATEPMLDLAAAGDGAFRITVTSADGKTTYLDWAALKAFGKGDPHKPIDDKGDVVRLTPQFNPVHDYVRVTGDFIQYDARDTIDRVHVEVRNPAGKALGQTDLALDELAYIEGIIHLGEIPFGTYTTKLTCRDANGEAILSRESTFEKKDHPKAFAWWNTERGSMDRVLAPWTLVTFDGTTFGIWGRTMAVGAAGLPRQVTTQGHSLFAGPATLVARAENGQAVSAIAAGQPTVTFDEDHRKVITCQGALGTVKVESEVLVEFDGLYKVTLRLTPETPLAVDSLQLRLPFTHRAAAYVHAAGEGIRTGFHYGFLPADKQGVLWTSKAVDSQPMAMGSFIPYVWIGSTRGGLCWFADSDAGWVPNDTTPALEIRRDTPASTDLVLNLISSPFTLDKPRTITFGLQASPVKKPHAKWRMDSWWCGDTFLNYSFTPSLIWTAIPFCLKPEECKKMVEARHKGKNSYIFGIDKYRANAVPYFIHQSLPGHLVPEMKYFGDQWTTSISECLYYGKTLTDYMVYHYSKWCEETGIDGYYVDNMRPVACDNIEAGRGYRLPDGRIQPTYQMFSTRRYFMRVRAAFAEQGRHNKIVLHMTNNMIIPWVGAADIAYDGEHHVIYPEMGKDFMDFWSLERMRVDFPGQWGVAVNFMHEYQGTWESARQLKAMRAYTGLVGLHDALPSGNANGQNQPFWIGRDRFGIEADNVEFTGYWEADTGVSCANADIRVSLWKRPGKVLLLVVNTGENANARLELDGTRLGIGAAQTWTVADAEAGTSLRGRRKVGAKYEYYPAWQADREFDLWHAGNGVLTVPVRRHDYRQVIVEGRGQ